MLMLLYPLQEYGVKKLVVVLIFMIVSLFFPLRHGGSAGW